MNEKKKVFCLLFAVLMLFTLSITAFAGNETNDGNIKIEVATNKDSYGATGVAEITATITNIGSNDLKNVTAQVVFDDLAPAGKGKSETSKSVDVLKSGESFSFKYKATLNDDEHNLNIFQKIILFFVRLFNGGYNASNNNIDVVAENVTEIKFDKFTAKNVVQVGYVVVENDNSDNTNDNNNTENDDNEEVNKPTYKELIENVDIDEIYEYEDSDVSIDDETGTQFINNIIIIMFEDDCSEETKADIVNSINGKIVGGDEIYDELYIEIEKSTLEEMENICSKLNEMTGVLDASYDELFRFSFNSTINDPFNNGEENSRVAWNSDSFTVNYNNWWCLATNLRNAWGYDEYFNNINIGIIDSGFSNVHEDLNIHIVSNENSAENHGTHVAGIISAIHNNEKGLAGVVNKASLYGYDAQNQNGLYSEKQIYKGLKELVKEYNCKVINFSISIDAYEKNNVYYFDEKFKHEITDKKIMDMGYEASKNLYKLLKKGYDFVVVQAAGNGAKNTSKGIDAEYSGFFASINNENCHSNSNITTDMIKNRVIVVANAEINSTNNTYQLHCSSNGNTNQIDLAAPGTNIYSTLTGLDDNTAITNGNMYGKLTGTSMASPIVSGIAGLVWSVNENFNGSQVKEIVCRTAEEGNTLVVDNPESTTTGDFYMVNAELAINDAIKKTYWPCTIKGKIFDKNRNPLTNVNYQITNAETNMSVTGFTISDGTFSVALPIGSYKLVFSKGENKIEIITKKLDYNETLEVNEQLSVENATVTGVVKDSVTNLPLSNIFISAINNEKSDEIISGTTDTNGCFSINVPVSSDYTFEIYNNDGDSVVLYQAIENSTVDLGTILFTSTRTITDSGTCGDNVTWTLYEDGELVISGSGKMEDYNSYTPWYSYRNSITKATMNDDITYIGKYAFEECGNLKNITLSKKLESIGAFAFYHCHGIVQIDFPNSLISIGNNAFWNCNGLEKINIHDNIKSIGESAFANCHNLKFITVDKNNCYYSSQNGVLFDIDKKILIQYPIGDGRITYSIPDGINTIGTESFSGAQNIKSIEIPTSVETIDDNAFSTCYSLANVEIPNNVKILGERAFYCCKSLKSIKIPSSVTSIHAQSFIGCENLDSIEIPDSVNYIGSGAFTNTAYYNKSKNWDNGSLYIGNYLIKVDTSVNGIYTIKNGTLCIASYAFENCTDITSISIPESLAYIGDFSFSNCTGITNVVIPGSVTHIGSAAFSFCENLTNIEFKDGVTAITTIGVYAFQGCLNIESIVFGNTIKSIEMGAFAHSSNIKSIVFSIGIINIDNGVFGQCKNSIDIYYKGTQKQWNEISIGYRNDCLTNSTNIHYNA